MEEIPLRAGIAGTGFVGRIHARAARNTGADLAGVAASTPERGREAAAELGAERAYDTADELVAAPDIDVVHICAPNHLHVPLAEAAIAAGKRVICEKPLALDADSAARLAEAAGPSGGGFVPFVYRYYPTVREARERVRGGALGAIRLVHGTYLQDWLLGADDDNWRVDAGLGGASRAFADIGSHWCDLAEFVSGDRITRLNARTMVAVPSRVRSEGRSAFDRDGGESGSSARSRPRMPRSSNSRPPAGRWAPSWSARSLPGARTVSGLRSTGPRKAWSSTRSSPKPSGAGAARRRW